MEAFSDVVDTEGLQALLDVMIDYDAGSRLELIPLAGMLIAIASMQWDIDIQRFKPYLRGIAGDAEEIRNRARAMLELLGDQLQDWEHE
jgi:hypothetical protein